MGRTRPWGPWPRQAPGQGQSWPSQCKHSPSNHPPDACACHSDIGAGGGRGSLAKAWAPEGPASDALGAAASVGARKGLRAAGPIAEQRRPGRGGERGALSALSQHGACARRTAVPRRWPRLQAHFPDQSLALMPKRDFPSQAPRLDPTVSPSVPQSASLGGPGCPLPQNSRAEGQGTAAKAAGPAARGLAESGLAESTCRAAGTSFGGVREGQASLPWKGEGAAGQLAGRGTDVHTLEG